MNALTTKEILEKVSASGDFKATAPVWKLFLLAIPGQAAVILWFRLYHRSGKDEQNG